jgi:ankyrin repeat protein
MQPTFPTEEPAISVDAPFHEAAKNGNIDQVKALIKEGKVVIDARGENNNTALQYAAEYGHAEIVIALIDAGANIKLFNADDKTPLHLATENGHAETVEVLLKNGAPVDLVSNDCDTALQLAAEIGWAKVVEVLLKNGVPVDRDKETYLSPLQIAAKYGHADVVEVLLKNGANIEADDGSEGFTPLLYAVEGGYGEVVEVVKVLLKNGAWIGKEVEGWSPTDGESWSAMDFVHSNKSSGPISNDDKIKLTTLLFNYGTKKSPRILEEINDDCSVSDTLKELLTKFSKPESILQRDEALRENTDLIKAYKNFILNGELTLDSAKSLILYNQSFGDVIVKAIKSITKEELDKIKEDPKKFEKIQKSGFDKLIELSKILDKDGKKFVDNDIAMKTIIKLPKEFREFFEVFAQIEAVGRSEGTGESPSDAPHPLLGQKRVVEKESVTKESSKRTKGQNGDGGAFGGR